MPEPVRCLSCAPGDTQNRPDLCWLLTSTISVQFIMPAALIMIFAVIVLGISMVVTRFFTPHWPTVLWTLFLVSGYVLQLTALWKAHKDNQPQPKDEDDKIP